MSKHKQRAKGTGSLFKPKDSRFWSIAYMSGGKRCYESTKKIDKAEAQKVLTARLGDVQQGIEVTPKMGKKTLGEGLKAVVQDQQLNERRSVAHTERRVEKHLLRHFSRDRRMANITTSDLKDYCMKRRAEGASAATCNLELAIVKRAYKLALQSRELMHAPHVPMLALRNARKGFFEREQFEAVRDALPEALRGIATVGYYTGLRVGEIKALEWSQVDRQTKVIRLEPGTTKNDEGRTIPYGLLPELVKAIDAAWKEHERLKTEDRICPYVFHRNGKRIKVFFGAWKTACTTAGCPGKLFHDFRRTAARNLVRNGVPEKTAMSITGHKTRSVFDRYHIVTEDDLREALGKLAPAPEAPPEEGTGKVKPFRKAR